jgi:hypothetical protein
VLLSTLDGSAIGQDSKSRTAARRRGHNRTRQQLHIDGANASFTQAAMTLDPGT